MSDPGAPIYRTMREIAEDERPRERLLTHGPERMSEADLVAIVLGSGNRGENVLDFARRIIEGAGGLAGLARSDGLAMQRIRGLGPARAAQLAAAIELGRRVQQLDPDARPSLTTPEAVFALLAGRFVGKSKEQLYVLGVDARGRLIGAPQPIGGGVNAITIRPSEIFREAIVLEATSVILVHNHPSGDPRPSPQDVATTARLIAAAKLLDIGVLDHVILGHGRWVSMKREGYAFGDRDVFE
ncbi:MAG: DNA repair protein RadC [Chloroflexi bacterium]|nr:DNA repair protein RadC [Chloroflexota bacterium]